MTEKPSFEGFLETTFNTTPTAHEMPGVAVDALSRTIIEGNRDLRSFEIRLIQQFVENTKTVRARGKGAAYMSYPLLDGDGHIIPTAAAFTMALGKGAMMRLVVPEGRELRQTLGVVTPDTDFYQQRLRFAYLGRMFPGGNLWVPDDMDPNNPKVTPASANIFLSSAYQMSTVGEHDPNIRISGADERHMMNAFQEFNPGTVGFQTLNAVDETERPHAADHIEQERGFMPLVSAQDYQHPERDLIHRPMEFTTLIDLGTPEESARKYTVKDPVGVVLTPSLLDVGAFEGGKIVPLRANYQDALAYVADMAFTTVYAKGSEHFTALQRAAEKRIEI